MADTSVKLFHSDMPGAPVLSGTAGAAIALFDACLVNGFGVKTVDSLVVVGGVATATIGTGHSADVDCVVLIAGATPSALNGEQRVTAKTGSTVQFAAPGVSDQTATGTITLKIAPAGWAKAFAGTNKAAYTSADPASLGMYLRVDDSGSNDIRVSGYETMSDVDIGTGQFDALYPTAGGGYWPKSATADSTARNWIIVADSRGFHFWAVPNWSTPDHAQGMGYWFGDTIPESSIDTYCCLLESEPVAASSYAGAASCMPLASSGTYAGMRMPRSFSGLGGLVSLGKYAASRALNAIFVLSGSGPSDYPNRPNNALLLDQVSVYEGSNKRATVPGLLHSNQALGFSFATRDTVDGAGALAGRKLAAFRTRASGYVTGSNADGAGYPGCSFLDITGPWRS
jgi:hypothetical protein